MAGVRSKVSGRWVAGRAGVGLALVSLVWSFDVRAEAAPDRYRKNAYYGAHGGAIAAMFGGSIALTLIPGGGRGPDPCWFPGDHSLRGRESTGAARASDSLIAVTIATPVAGALGKGVSPRFLNTGVVYAETLSANLLLNSLAKVLFRRPRPYTYRYLDDSRADDDWYVSFYSGHSSTAFSSAVAGSYLFAESAPNRASRVAMWGAELTLASATAMLRVRAGKHYYSDVVVGMLMGIGLGIGVPVLNGARYRPEAGELIAAGGGVVLGTTTAALLPFEQDGPVASDPDPEVSVLPSTFENGAVGLLASGTF
jgi:membrane-associated phospholipid phosphatase